MVVLQGLVFTFFLASGVQLLHYSLPAAIQGVLGVVVVGVLVSLIINNFLNPRNWIERYRPGIKFSFDKLLKFSIVLLGLRISFQEILSIGGKGLVLVLCTISIGWFVAHKLGRILGVPRKLAGLIGIGTAVCGNTAISATGPAIDASDEEISFAIATNTLFGTLAVFLYPVLGHIIGMNDQAFGLWAGAAVNDTSQVIATAFSYSDSAGEVATTIKLTRNTLMGVVIVLATSIYGTNQSSEKPMLIKVPNFVLQFLIVAILNSLGLFAWIDQNFFSFIDHAKLLTRFLILMALIAVGLNTNLKAIKKLGLKPLILGISSALTVSITSLILINLLS